jgi:hypothetical protein
MFKTGTRIGVCVITIAAWSLLGISLHGGLGSHVDVRAHETSGRLMAQQALACLAPGGQITLFTRDTTTFKNPATDLQLATFLKTISQAHVVIHSFHALQVDPLRPIAVPSSEFCEVIRNTPEDSVIVSFLGPPLLTPTERSRLGDINPAIVAFCSGGLPELEELSSLFKQGLLKAAVVDCRGAKWPAHGAANQRDYAERSFLTLTATNLAELAALQGVAP